MRHSLDESIWPRRNGWVSVRRRSTAPVRLLRRRRRFPRNEPTGRGRFVLARYRIRL